MNQTAVVAETRRTEISIVRSQLEAMAGEFARVLPSHIPAKQFTRVVLTAVQMNRELLECDRLSLWNACTRAATDGLLPDGRQGAIVVFRDKKRGIKVAQWMPMIAGIRQKIRNSGEIATLDCDVVREHDHWEYERGDHPRIVHRPVRGERGRVIAAYSIAKDKAGELSREWMWVEEIEEVRARSRSAESGPWVTDFAEMCKKTVARRHSKVLPMSTDVLGLLNRSDDLDLERISAATAPQPEPRALSDALNMLAAAPDHRAAPERDPIDEPFTDEEAEGHADGLDAVREREDAAAVQNEPVPGADQAQAPRAVDPGMSQEDRSAAVERQHVEEANERVRYLQTLNDAATVGMLDQTFRRFPKRWQRELDADYKALKFRGETGGE